jgi:hypothetical protein
MTEYDETVDLRMSMRKTMRMTIRTPALDLTYEQPAPPRRIPVNLSLPEDLVTQLDEVAGPRRRSAFAEEAIRKAIQRERLRVSIERTAGAWKGKGPAMWDEPGGVERWVRELRREETDAGVED